MFQSFLRILKGLFFKKSLEWGLGQSPKNYFDMLIPLLK